MYEPHFSDDEFRRPALQYFLPNNDGKVILYTYIRKNACSAFKRLINDKTGGSGIPGMKEFRWDGKSRIWNYSIFVYREPFGRAVSAFSNKFIAKSGNRDIFASFEKLMGKKASTATFRDFVKYTELPFDQLDPHVWPQKSHLLNIDYTHAIDIKDLAEVITKNFPSISKYFDRKTNKGITSEGMKGDFSDIPASEIEAHSGNNFESMREAIEVRYCHDLEMVKCLSKKAITRHFIDSGENLNIAD